LTETKHDGNEIKETFDKNDNSEAKRDKPIFDQTPKNEFIEEKDYYNTDNAYNTYNTDNTDNNENIQRTTTNIDYLEHRDEIGITFNKNREININVDQLHTEPESVDVESLKRSFKEEITTVERKKSSIEAEKLDSDLSSKKRNSFLLKLGIINNAFSSKMFLSSSSTSMERKSLK